MAEAMKRCSKCGQVKALDEFHRFVHSKDGRKPHCAICNTKAANQFAAENKAASTEKKMEWYRRQPEDYRKRRERAWNAKRGATLPDSYVATCVARTAFSASLVPKDVIEMKREQLSLRRLAEVMQQAANEAKENQQ